MQAKSLWAQASLHPHIGPGFLAEAVNGSSNETKGGAAGTNKASAAIKAEKTREALKKGKKLFTAAEEIAAREEQEREWEIKRQVQAPDR